MARRRGSLQQEKNGTWTARVRVGDKTYCRTTGTGIRAEAEASLERLVVIADCGRRGMLERVALLKAWPRYESSAFAARLAPGSRHAKYRAWLHFSVWIHGAHPEVKEPEGVTHSMAEEYLAFYQGGHAPITCTLRICFLREMFRIVLAGCGVDARNPWDGVRPKSGPVCPRRELTLDEVRRLLSAAGGFGREWRMLFSLAIYTGMRLGDCCRLGWEAVDLASSVIQIVPHKTRRYFVGRPIVIPLHPELAALLGETKPECRCGFVMDAIARDFVVRRWTVSRTLERIFAMANIRTSILLEGRERRTPLATFHSLRHTFVSIAVNAGVPLAAVQSIVGHTSTAMTRHYYHPSEDVLRQAVAAIPSISAGSGTSSPRPHKTWPRIERSRNAMPSLCARLRELEKARNRGLISAEEFRELRQGVLVNA
ncbi:MAG: tyrosine-type recombinase/integrase [Kiritimatiellia bacterium]